MIVLWPPSHFPGLAASLPFLLGSNIKYLFFSQSPTHQLPHAAGVNCSVRIC